MIRRGILFHPLWQLHLKSCPFPFLGGNSHIALQKPGQCLDETEAEAGALDELVHLVEAIVDVGQGGLGDAFSGVFHVENDGVCPVLAAAQGDVPVRGEFAGVVHQVHQNLTEAGRVCPDA